MYIRLGFFFIFVLLNIFISNLDEDVEIICMKEVSDVSFIK